MEECGETPAPWLRGWGIFGGEAGQARVNFAAEDAGPDERRWGVRQAVPARVLPATLDASRSDLQAEAAETVT
jgi:hypothetical protein